jgi:hypothetical protein
VSSLDLAAELEARAAVLRAEGGLEVALTAAREAAAADPTPANREAERVAAVALREARAARRSEGVTVGGDAYVDEEI